MDKKAILAAIKARVTGEDGRKDKWGDSYFDEYDTKALEEICGGAIAVKQQEQEGGEGQGEDYHVVYLITDGNNSMYVMLTGFYSSYEGVDWSYGEVREVAPYEKTITAWKEVS